MCCEISELCFPYPGKFPKVPGRRRGTRGFPAVGQQAEAQTPMPRRARQSCGGVKWGFPPHAGREPLGANAGATSHTFSLKIPLDWKNEALLVGPATPVTCAGEVSPGFHNRVPAPFRSQARFREVGLCVPSSLPQRCEALRSHPSVLPAPPLLVLP